MKFLNPCNRCRFAKLFNNQSITGDKDEKSLPLVAAKCRFLSSLLSPISVNSVNLLTKFSEFTEIGGIGIKSI